MTSLCILYSWDLAHNDKAPEKNCHQPSASTARNSSYELIEMESRLNYSMFLLRDLFPDKYVVYTCTGTSRGRRCGGWSDRMKTIVMSYILSLLTNRQFRILDNFPCDFKISFDENLVQWKINGSELKGLTHQNFYASAGVKVARNHFRGANLETIHKPDVIYFRGNWDFLNEFAERPNIGESFPWLLKLPRPDIYRAILRMILKHTDTLQRHVQEIFTEKVKNSRLVCAHVRQGRSKTLPNDDSTDVREKDIETIFKFLSQYQIPNHKIFIATDSVDIINSARERFQDFLLEVPGPITHMDISKSGELCHGQQKSFTEHEILTRCDTLLLTRSGFGIIAAFLRKNSDDLYCLSHHYISPCSRYTLSKIYPWTLSPWDDL
ncbi:uncharacterized protein LOC133173522 [Saccostrea echinata]|uniref:uncharacterized protein LOC133173522 n=1 Tax=Saccostrea echinata TaxID=191078 RepID=UPI002A7F6D65|nr:uncharacterized protein LOC133173522 [Saccostrea echinata]